MSVTVPDYPIYIPSKGRAESRLTMKALDKMRVQYHVIVEAQEYDQYAAVVDPAKLLVLDLAYQRDYETLDDLGDSKSKGPGPARNFAWDHAESVGADRHWVIDDNVHAFYRFHQNTKIQVHDGAFFRAMEDWCDRYQNVAMAGPHYEHFVTRRSKKRPIILNSRIYSCNLILTSAPFRWRGRYNEDTILSLDMLKSGWCLALFTAFLQNKVATQVMDGGNSDEFYRREGTLPKSQMQVAAHPDVSRLVWKFGRWHHHVDYRKFKHNRLKLKPGIEIPQGVNNYGMKLVTIGAD